MQKTFVFLGIINLPVAKKTLLKLSKVSQLFTLINKLNYQKMKMVPGSSLKISEDSIK